MSSSNNQKVRRNAASPSTRQGPLRATQQFALVGGSPSRKHVVRQNLTTSPTPKANKAAKARSHSETGFVSERRSPTSPIYKVEKPKALRASGSLDSINLYLSGQWPKDACSKQKSQENLLSNSNIQHPSLLLPTTSYYSDGVFKKDEHTQTPEEWDEIDSKRQLSHSKFVLYKRSKSAGSGDNWNLKSRDIKAKLQRKDNSIRASQTIQRFSPVPVISNSVLSPQLTISTQPIKIPVPILENGGLRGTPGKARASVEGLNPEIEKLIISATSAINSGDEDSQTGVVPCIFDYPDGHRAPVPDSLNNTRNMDTQTPSYSELAFGYSDTLAELSAGDYYYGRSSSRASTDTEDGSRPQSVSPSPFLLGPLDIDEPSADNADAAHISSVSDTSPHPNNAQFVRLPPEGAEKLKLINEMYRAPPTVKEFLTPDLMTTVKIQPSERSAFSSLSKAVKTTTVNQLPTAATAIIPSRSPVRFVEESH